MNPSRLSENCLHQLQWTQFPSKIRGTAHLIREAALQGRQIPLLSKRDTNLDQSNAYKISAAGCVLARKYGLTPVGRKIGFTNTKIWSEYNVSEPNWGYLWDKRSQPLKKGRNDVWLSQKQIALQPRIEPEIIFCLKEEPHSRMTEREALSCVEWIAHGYEIVVSLFKDWKFTAADTTATNALHSHLYIGEKRYLEEKDLDTLTAQLQDFEIKLHRNKELVDTGRGSNVLGSPIKALLHLCHMLENQDLHPGLSIGEIITTGTLTKAIPIDVQQTWSTSIEGIDLPGLELRFRPVPASLKHAKVRYRGDFKLVNVKT